MFQTKVVDEIKTHMCRFSNIFPHENPAVGNYGTASRAQKKMRFAWRITKARIQTQAQNI